MASVKKITVARFMELAAAEGISPDFDRFRPGDLCPPVWLMPGRSFHLQPSL